VEITSLTILFFGRGYKVAVCNQCGELVSRGGGSTKSYNTSNLISCLRSQHLDKYTEFSKLNAEKESERETARKERSKAPGISGLWQLTLHGESMDKVKQWCKSSIGT